MSCALIIMCMHAKKEARRTKNTEEHVVVGLSVNVLKKQLPAKSGTYSARIHANSHNAL